MERMNVEGGRRFGSRSDVVVDLYEIRILHHGNQQGGNWMKDGKTRPVDKQNNGGKKKENSSSWEFSTR